jgi:hypothetical protein
VTYPSVIIDSKVNGIECKCLNDDTFIVAAESDTDDTYCINGVLGRYYPYSSAEWVATSVTCGSTIIEFTDEVFGLRNMKDRSTSYSNSSSEFNLSKKKVEI